MISDRLSRKESEVMNAVFRLSGGKERFLASPCEIAALLPSSLKIGEETLETLLNGLALDGYFELVESERKGEPVYVFHMREAGLNFRREDYQRKRSVCFRWVVAAVGAVITFFVGILLKVIFK